MTDTTYPVESTTTATNEVQNTKSPQEPAHDNRTVMPRASVREHAEEVTLELEMPGVDRETLQVVVENDELTISARRALPRDEGFEVLHQERLPYGFRRSFILSDRIDTASIKAAYNDGILTVTLPKAAKAKPFKITVE